jgi:hypothetical protein
MATSRNQSQDTRDGAGDAMEARTRSRIVARLMLRGAVALFREELRKGANEQRVAEARAGMVFWRERLQVLTFSARA